QSNPAKIQEYIFQKIVLPLEAYAVNPEPESTLTNLRCSDQRHLDKPKTTLSPMSLYDESVNYDEPEDKCSQADGFFRDMRKFTERYVSGISKDTRRPKLIDRKIRIAVIDSGVRKVDPTICGARSGKHKKIQDCRNFSSSDPKDWDDEVGHGTMVTHLLLDVAPEAELFIAKVSSQKKIPRNKLYHIAEAINWAVQEWKVDIITISIALSEENHLIDEALEQALDPSFDDATGKIIFAAAGNKGGNGQQAWPARKKGVIAIHATDWYGTAANFNSTSDEGNVNFATLGRDIRVEWLSDVDSGEWKNRYISGTSFATPIAAGIAANVLEFARHKLKRTTRRRDRLFSHDGMRKIFRAMSSRIVTESNRNSLDIPLFGVEGSLKRLETIAAAILQATQASLTRRVIAYAKKQQDYKDIVRRFSTIILARYRGLGPTDMPMFIRLEDLPSCEDIMRPKPLGLFFALVKCSVVRHYRIIYERNETDKDNKKALLEAPLAEEPKPPEDNSDRTTERPNKRAPVSEAGIALYPRPPKLSEGQKDATCPICKKVLSANEFENLSWISHVNKDIKPYVCISEECMPNLQFFESRASWIDHMHKKHTTQWIRYLHNTFFWNCPVCHVHSPTEFTSKGEMEENLVEHMRGSHSDVVEESDRQYMASLSGVPQHRPVDICPICGEQSDDEDIKRPSEVVRDPSKTTRLTGVEKCIGDHLKALAF
ncbi:putative subtilisin, partial [Acephala macrosclerotiorum]